MSSILQVLGTQVIMLKYIFQKILKPWFALEQNKKFEDNMLVFMEAVPSPVFWLDRNKAYQGCNQIFSDLMGLASPLDIVGLYDKDLSYSAEDLNTRNNIFDAILQDQAPTKILYDCILGFGDKIVWIQKRFTPLKDHKGKIVGIFGAVIDISEKVNRRKKMDIYLGQRNVLGGLLEELNAIPVFSTKYKELMEKSIINLQMISQAKLAILIKEKAKTSESFLRFTTGKLDAEDLFKNKDDYLKMSARSGYLNESEIKNFQDVGTPIESIFYYRICLNDFIKYDEIILLINPHKERLEEASSYLALTQHIIHYFHVGRFVATAKQLIQQIKKNIISSSN